MEKRHRTRLASAGVLAVVFASGALVGAAVDRTLEPDAPVAEAGTQDEPAAEQAAPGGGTRGRGDREQTFFYEQVLSPQQIQVADSLVRVHQEARDALRRRFRRDTDSIVAASGRAERYESDLDSLANELRSSVRALMAPEQLATYDSIIAAELERRRAQREAREQQQGQRPSPPNDPPH